MPVIKLTKSAIDNLSHPPKGQTLYFDSELKGFGLCVGKSSKTYFVQGTASHRRVRHAIGRHGVVTAEQARNEARQKLADMYRGIDPAMQHQKNKANSMTVSEALEEYLHDRNAVREVTADGYRGNLRLYLPDWLDRPLVSISKTDVLERHRIIGDTKGPSAANKSMRVLRMLFNYMHAKYDNMPENPCRYITLLKGWYKIDRKRTYIKPQDLSKWYWGVQQVVNPAIRDYLILLLFTGLRKSEAAGLRWDTVDMEDRVFTIKMTKNGDPHTLPMSDFLYEFFRIRKLACGTSPWVFPGHGRNGHMTEPKKAVFFVARLTGIKFSLHDLRRTFITTAESTDLPHNALKKLLNHRSGDITSSYIIIDVERLREPMDRVSKKIEDLIGDGKR